MSNNSLIVLFFQESLKSKLDLRLYCHMFPEFLFVSSLCDDTVLIIVFFYQNIRICPGDSIYRLGNFINRIGVDLPSEFNLSFNLIAFCYRNISHVICDSHNTDMAAFHNAYCRPHP